MVKQTMESWGGHVPSEATVASHVLAELALQYTLFSGEQINPDPVTTTLRNSREPLIRHKENLFL